MKPRERNRLPREPHVKSKELFGPQVDATVRALGHFRQVPEESQDELVRPLALGRECVCDSIRALFTRHAVTAKCAPITKVSPGGFRQALGILRSLFRIAKDSRGGHGAPAYLQQLHSRTEVSKMM